MAGSNRISKNFIIVLLAGCMALLVSGIAWSQSQTGMSDNQGQAAKELVIKGAIKDISLETKTIVIKPKKGPALNITFYEHTILIGVESFDDLKKKQTVTIWYTIEGETNLAIKLERAPQVGC